MREIKFRAWEKIGKMKQEIAALPEVARVINDIKHARDAVRDIEDIDPRHPIDIDKRNIAIIGDLDLILEWLLSRATLAAYNLGWEQRGDAEFEQGRISKEEEHCSVPRGR